MSGMRRDPMCSVCGQPIEAANIVWFDHGELTHIDCHTGMVGDLADKVVTVLARYPGQDFCHACLAQEMNVAHQSVQKAVVRLRSSAEVSVRVGECSRCQRPRVTVRARFLGRTAASDG